MNLYNKKELLERLNKGFELNDDEYKALIKNGQYEIGKKLSLLNSNEYTPTLIGYTTLGMLASEMNYDGEDDNEISRAGAYMLTALLVNPLHYVVGFEDSKLALNRICRYNTFNFIRELDEINNYDSLMGNLYNSISEVVQYGFDGSSSDDLQERIDDLEESRVKIKTFRNKYFK